MTEFQREITGRLVAARAALDEARGDGDDYLVQVLLGEIESLERRESDHRPESDVIDLREAEADRAQHA
jgi:hypothetical protein